MTQVHEANIAEQVKADVEAKIAELVKAHAERGHLISDNDAILYLTQQGSEEAEYQSFLNHGTAYNWDDVRPYGMQYLCGCGNAFAVWATENYCDGKPDRIVYCETCAANAQNEAERNGEEIDFVRLLTIEQIQVAHEWDAADIGGN